MSKTTTIAATRNLRSANMDADNAAHHVITRGKGESKHHIRDSNSSKSKEDLPPNEPSRGRRISIKSNSASTENSKVKKTDQNHPIKMYKDTRTERSEQLNVSSVLKNGNKYPVAIPVETEKVPLADYYAKQGIDYRLLRKNCQIRVNGEGSATKAAGGLYLDSYQLPEGYTAEDLPESQGMFSQDSEDPISPAVMIAAHHKKERTKILSLTPDTDSSEIIRRIQMGRRYEKGDESTRCSKLNAANLVVPQNGLTEFPDNSLNDSDLIMASQQVESDFAECEAISSKDAIKRDFNGNNKNQTPSSAPFTSTPLPALIKNVTPSKETPKTARAVSRNRNRSNGQGNHTGIFEKSVFEDSSEHGLPLEGDGDATPRKILKFDESPIKSVKNIILENVLEVRGNENEGNLRSGDFDDDNEDELFSQVEMPAGDIRVPKSGVFESSSDSVNSPPATQLVDEDDQVNTDPDCGEMDSYLDDDALDAIAKLEAIHCTSSVSTTTGKSADVNKNNFRPEEKVVKEKKVTQDTPRTRARRMGLSRRVVVN